MNAYPTFPQVKELATLLCSTDLIEEKTGRILQRIAPHSDSEIKMFFAHSEQVVPKCLIRSADYSTD